MLVVLLLTGSVYLVFFIFSHLIGVGFDNNEIIELKPIQEVLVGVKVSCERETFHMYNDYAYKVGFSVRYSKTRNRCNLKGGGVCMRKFCCWQGFK